MQKQKTWFITGASKGFGLALTQLLLARGDKVVSSSRNVEQLSASILGYEDTFLPLQVDLRSDKAVAEALAYARQHFGDIDVVVNNAGYCLAGSVEEISDEEFRQTMDVNFFATINVIRHIMPHFRAQRAGHIINIASIAGYFGIPLASSYSASKYAVVGLTEALTKEVSPFGVKVTLVAPGEFRTNFMEQGSIAFAAAREPEYELDQAEVEWAEQSGKQPGDPQKLVNILAEVADMENPPKRLILGPDAHELFLAQQAEETNELKQHEAWSLSTDFDQQ
ncbi:SDR family oxidoreductase [Sphingobacterium bambusae]|uniref:SDR family oxidoreductase n=1 Tax=Sphingobacterium bambusae TaxID=662858 RepID=A0ABW6BP31_9SPHI|nr:SDR family oxidoreductase [Sphingobacterium bambusae]WPL48179.1 SDR family oxidoreductase [Sphingobacterium bambusae]